MRLIVATIALAAVSATSAMAEPFSGPYLGVELSRDAYEVQANDLSLELDGTPITVSADGLSANGVAGGVFAGYDLRVSGSAFVGVEANFNYSSASISASGTDGVDTLSGDIKARESYGVGARLGALVSSNTAVYARLGWQNTKFKTTASLSGSSVSDSRTEDAFVYGGGLETFLNDRLSLRVEYTRADYGDAGLNQDLGVNGMKVENDKVSLGASYRF